MTTCRIGGCSRPTWLRSSMCLIHIESGRAFLWNRLGINKGCEQKNESELCVYVMRGESMLKFGVSRNVRERFVSVSAGSHEKLTLNGSVKGSRRLEAVVLAYLEPDKVRGEWFRDTPRTRFMEKLIQGGNADAVWAAIRSGDGPL